MAKINNKKKVKKVAMGHMWMILVNAYFYRQ